VSFFTHHNHEGYWGTIDIEVSPSHLVDHLDVYSELYYYVLIALSHTLIDFNVISSGKHMDSCDCISFMKIFPFGVISPLLEIYLLGIGLENGLVIKKEKY